MYLCECDRIFTEKEAEWNYRGEMRCPECFGEYFYEIDPDSNDYEC